MSRTEHVDGPSPPAATIRPRIRLLVRLACLVLALLCLLPVGGKDTLRVFVPSVSVFVALASVLTTKALRPLLIPGLVAGVMTWFRQRWLCRWMCPLGLCLDSAGWLGTRLKRRPSQALALGQWLCALTLGGAVLGVPLFLWLDPLSLFTGVFLWAERQSPLRTVPLLLVALLLILSLWRPHVWCRGVCPLGALQDLLAVMARSVSRRPKSANYTECRRGWAHPVTRRTVLGLPTGAAAAGILGVLGHPPAPQLRPPGAVDTHTLSGLCTRCGNCVRSCPYDIIRHHNGHRDVASFMTPVLTFAQDYCREDCTRCTQVCPSGALKQVAPDNKAYTRIGRARVDMNLCLLGEDRECAACMRWCPYQAVRYVFSEAEYALVPTIDPERCNGCGACEVACPTRPSKAIRILAEGTTS